MRSLAVVQALTLPPVSGGEQRTYTLVATLAELGEVDVFCTHESALERRGGAQDQWPNMRFLAPVTRAVPRWIGHPRWLVSRHLPSALAFVDRRTLRRELRRWRRRQYDVALFVGADGWYAVSDLVDGPQIVDLPDLMDVWTDRQRCLHGDVRRSPRYGRAPDLRAALRHWRLSTGAKRWNAYYRSMAARVSVMTVCSDLDSAHLGVSNAAVVPNGYDRRSGPVGKLVVGTPPTLVFPGLMNYGPNANGAKYLVGEVLPLLLDLLPEVRIVIAGDAPQGVRSLADPPRVEVTGWVDNMDDVLSRADAVVVPLQVGGGTRIKIIEAWAHEIPVVSTSVGAEGLDCVSGRELLLADDPEEFAKACYDIVTNRGLRQRVVEAGRRRAMDLTWTRSRERFREVVIGALNQGSSR